MTDLVTITAGVALGTVAADFAVLGVSYLRARMTQKKRMEALTAMRDQFEAQIKAQREGTDINGTPANALD